MEEPEILMSAVKSASVTLNRNKSTGPDKIPIEILRALDDSGKINKISKIRNECTTVMLWRKTLVD